MERRVNICGIEHKVKYVKDKFDSDTHFGQINFNTAEIFINEDSTEDIQRITLCHEIIHGILTHIGRGDLSNDEVFVTTLSSAIDQTFEIKNPKVMWIGENGEIREIRKETR